MPHDTVAVSAPGKVLLAGGYLVLDRAYTGLVFGLDARIHVHIEEISTSSGVALNEITVRSPQFLNAVWNYGYRQTEKNGGIEVTQLKAGADQELSKNPFIETTLSYVLSYITTLTTPTITPASIIILADNDYYTNPVTSSSSSTTSTPQFHNFAVPLSQAHKTGLGSSAALVTAITAALLTHYLPSSTFSLTDPTSRRRLHNLAQAAHCAAQGKVGSGFDVASAVYGSCLYRRFSPSILEAHGEPGTPGFADELRALVEEAGGKEWDTEIKKDEVSVPKGLRLVMCDVSCGSQTPGMVKKVLAWRKEKREEAEQVWRELDEANLGLAGEMKKLADANEQSRDYGALRAAFEGIRKGIRDMSVKSGVPIEPPSQTELIDACEKVPGVLGGVVPGAGGYDAISLMIEDRQDTIDSLRKLFSTWQFKGEDSGSEGRVSMLGVREEMEGVKVEDASRYQEWTQETV